MFTQELRDFFNASSFADMLADIKPALDDPDVQVRMHQQPAYTHTHTHTYSQSQRGHHLALLGMFASMVHDQNPSPGNLPVCSMLLAPVMGHTAHRCLCC